MSYWTDRNYTAVVAGKRHGVIKRLPCERCCNPKAHAHHEDYSKPLDVIWLCRKCHCARHKELGWGMGGKPIKYKIDLAKIPVDGSYLLQIPKNDIPSARSCLTRWSRLQKVKIKTKTTNLGIRIFRV